MSSNLILAILAASGLLTLLLKVIVELRDRMIDDGWLDEKSWLARTRQRGLQRRLAPALGAIGITSDHFDALRGAADREAGRRRISSETLRERPDQALLQVIKPWIVDLDEGAAFRGNDRYVDTMGLVHQQASGMPSLAAICDAWVALLMREDVIEPFDCVVTLKDGNPVLITEFCNRVSPTRLVKPILCKGEHDPSRVQRDTGPHETDLEGLRAFLKSAGPPAEPRHRYRALALDDNCTSGRSLYAAISEFNEFVEAHSARYPIEPITQAAVLFVVNSGESSDFAFKDTGITLNSMLALGTAEMKKIEETRERDLSALATQLKNHPACAFSQTLGDVSAQTSHSALSA